MNEIHSNLWNKYLTFMTFPHQPTTFQKQPPEVFYEKSVLRNFSKFTGKHLRQSLFFNKVAGLKPGTGVSGA